ncbi:MAG TPA: trigger factor [Candidatus Eisenbacteria bacterium]|nr:trigger factor [Candidatus Eisenbacteria bacterium]
MLCTTKKLPKGMVEVSCEIPLDEIAKELEDSARKLSEDRPIEGYRPGKAPFDVVKQRFGEMAIYEGALPAVVRKYYVKAITEHNVHSYGEPNINVTKLAPGNPIAFTATCAAVPEITSLADFRKVKVEQKKQTIDDARVDGAVKDLQHMQTKEVRAAREARDKDKIIVDMDLSQKGVPLDGGQARNHGIYLDEDYYIPGLKEKVLGMKEGEKREFSLKFPDTHYQKMLAGKDIDFAVTLKEVYELQNPPLDDAFAKTLGQENMEKLRGVLRENMLLEAEDKEKQRVELEILDMLVAKSKFEDVPDKIMTDEVARMIDELKHGLDERGVKFEDYLVNIKKTLDDLRMEFSAQAIKRIQTAILIREIGEKEKVEVSDADVLAEVQNLMNQYAENAEAQEQVRTEEYQDYLRASLRNRKVLGMLRDAATK